MIKMTYERQRRNLTKFKLGSLTEIHPAEIGKIESGQLKPYKAWIERLEKFFGIPIEELLMEVEDSE